MFLFAHSLCMKGAYVPGLQKAVIDSGNAKYIYKFSQFVKDEDKKVFQDALIKSGNAEYMYKFATKTKNADYKELQDAVNKTGKQRFIERFQKYVIENNNNSNDSDLTEELEK